MKKGYEAVLVEGTEALADDLAGVDDGDKAVGVVLPQKVAQLQSLTAGEHGHQYAELVVGVGHRRPFPPWQSGSCCG